MPQVVQRILEHLRDMASKWLSAKVKKAVCTVPVEFDIRSKREIELAARMAGIEIMGMIPEPVAAAMGCGHDGKGEATVAVYDFGGGTFDASIVQVGQHRFSVRGAAGDRWLGGDDFDETIARYVADEFQKNTGLSLHNRAEEWQRLLFASEEAKRWLSTLETVDVVLPRAANTPKGPLTLLVPMTRQIFQEITDDILTSSLEVCRTATRRARVNPRDVTVLLVTGGTTRILRCGWPQSVSWPARRRWHSPRARGGHWRRGSGRRLVEDEAARGLHRAAARTRHGGTHDRPRPRRRRHRAHHRSLTATAAPQPTAFTARLETTRRRFVWSWYRVRVE